MLFVLPSQCAETTKGDGQTKMRGETLAEVRSVKNEANKKALPEAQAKKLFQTGKKKNAKMNFNTNAVTKRHHEDWKIQKTLPSKRATMISVMNLCKFTERYRDQ